MLNFQIYTGKADAQQQHGLAHRVVTDLVLPRFAHANHIVYMDNFFSSLPLVDELGKNGVMCCGTYRTGRLGFPAELANKDNLKQLKRGDSLMRHKGETTVITWKDKKPVFVVTSAHDNSIVTVNRRNPDGTSEQVTCPYAVAEYNRYMGGVDLSDQLKKYYSYDRKSKRWWLRLFYHLLDLCVVNVYILCVKCYRLNWHPPLKYKCMSQLDFRTQLIDHLVNHFTCRKLRGPPITPVVSLVPSGNKIADIRPLGIRAGWCELCSVGPQEDQR